MPSTRDTLFRTRRRAAGMIETLVVIVIILIVVLLLFEATRPTKRAQPAAPKNIPANAGQVDDE